MPRTNYCLPIDVTRRFDPTITQSDLDKDNYLTVEDIDTIKSRIEGVEADFEDRTGTALRTVRVGSQGTPATYEKLESKRNLQFPVTYTLDHHNVLPIDASAGDTIELRTARDNWRDITADEGSRWVLIDPRRGKLEFYSRLMHTVQFRVRPGVRFIRLTYRYGGLGGSPTEGGQTTLEASGGTGTGTTTNTSVGDAARLPDGGGVMLADGTEYVRVDNVDVTNDEVDLVERGLRRTTATDHASGVTLHYCPMNVREAIAAKAAVELAEFEHFVDQLVETGDGLGLSDARESWNAEYDRVVARYAQWGYS